MLNTNCFFLYCRWFTKEGGRLIPVIDDESEDQRSSWKAQGPSPGKSSHLPGLIKIRHGALIIDSVKVGHKGFYLCNTSNSEGSDFQEVSNLENFYFFECLNIYAVLSLRCIFIVNIYITI